VVNGPFAGWGIAALPLLLLARRVVYSPSPIGETGLQPVSYWSGGL
jgi:hypothetical protein